MTQKFFILTTSLLMIQYSLGSICNIPKECKMVFQKKRHIQKLKSFIKCSLESGNQLRFLEPKDSKESCKISNTTQIEDFFIRPKYQGSSKLEKGMIDLRDLGVAMNEYIILHFQHFKGFELNLFEESNGILNYRLGISLEFNDFEFFLGEKKIGSCQDFIEATYYSNNPRSILQFSSIIGVNLITFYLTETKNKICPLVWKNAKVYNIQIYGENSFFSKRVFSFSNESFPDLNSSINYLTILVPNVELDSSFLHPDVFRRLNMIYFLGKVKKIHPDVFSTLNNLKFIQFENEYLKSVMHSSGIEWIKNLNRDIDWDMENLTQLYYYREKIKAVFYYCTFPPLITDLFPEEDFCLYKDFPIKQLVVIIQFSGDDSIIEYTNNHTISCTYLWITRSYKSLINMLPYEYEIYTTAIIYLLNSSDYRSIDKCNFEQKFQLCNKSTFKPKHINTIFELDQAMLMTQSIINILSYIISIFGIVTNLLVIITISSKKNKEEFKDIKQYDYLRLNSICNCLILLIHIISWLNECIYPFQVFCPIIRKTVFMQWFKIIVEETLINALKSMNNFTYIGFAFNRISLIGKDHNKLVKFMSDLGTKKYIAFSLFISIGLSVIKFFEYDINPGLSTQSYPIFYDYFFFIYINFYLHYILNFISDLLNHVVFLLINLAIDIGMIVKLRQTLKERLEKARTYSTQTQLEAKNKENENVMKNARSMIIWNTSLNLTLKLPSALYSLFYLYAQISQYYSDNHLLFLYFYHHVCIDANYCNMYIKLSDSLYFICISIQLFFYKHYDKKFAQSFKRIFEDKKAKSKK